MNSNTAAESARVHRFHEFVAVSVEGVGVTSYLSAALARQLSEELARFAREISDGVRFSDSKVGTVELSGEES